MVKPWTLSVASIRCLFGVDERPQRNPYAIVAAIHLPGGAPITEVMAYGPWPITYAGSCSITFPIPIEAPDVIGQVPSLVWRRPYSVPSPTIQAMDHPDNVIVLVVILERNDGKPLLLQQLVNNVLVAGLASTVGLHRAARVEALIQGMNKAISIPADAATFDSPLVSTSELRLTPNDLLRVQAGIVQKDVLFVAENGLYAVQFELGAAA